MGLSPFVCQINEKQWSSPIITGQSSFKRVTVTLFSLRKATFTITIPDQIQEVG
ncbi:hypothetical protein [Acinetobacter sp.]|uniref:hypothetical protein n=1 Tax=Acinetobacter sp. TaxID=472 RepID=UPI0028AEAD6C|nr:hypothetical protein [Acinetobacter sp.]